MIDKRITVFDKSLLLNIPISQILKHSNINTEWDFFQNYVMKQEREVMK